MFKFIKNLLGIGAQESVKEILTPQAPYKIEPPNEVVITRALAPASNPDVIVTPVVKEGKTRANVKKPNPNNKKPSAPPAPKAKQKAKPTNKPKAKTKK